MIVSATIHPHPSIKRNVNAVLIVVVYQLLCASCRLLTMSSAASKKRKSSPAASAPAATTKTKKISTNISSLDENANGEYSALSLQDIYDRIADICRKIPVIPESGFVLQDGKAKEKEPSIITSLAVTATSADSVHYDQIAIKTWATKLQTVLEEFHLLLACISPATYVWGTDRSGAADQNLNLLSNELVRSQEQIAARVTPRLNDVLAPVVTLLTSKTVTTKAGDAEIKQNYYVTTVEDPDYVNFCYSMLAKNAGLLRHVVLANIEKLLVALKDYANAQHTDSQHDSRGLLY
jgi:hypothetical protein